MPGMANSPLVTDLSIPVCPRMHLGWRCLAWLGWVLGSGPALLHSCLWHCSAPELSPECLCCPLTLMVFLAPQRGQQKLTSKGNMDRGGGHMDQSWGREQWMPQAGLQYLPSHPSLSSAPFPFHWVGPFQTAKKHWPSSLIFFRKNI